MDLWHLFYVDGLERHTIGIMVLVWQQLECFWTINLFLWAEIFVGVGDFIGESSHPDNKLIKHKLTQVEKDRIKVLLISFLLIIIFGVLLNKPVV